MVTLLRQKRVKSRWNAASKRSPGRNTAKSRSFVRCGGRSAWVAPRRRPGQDQADRVGKQHAPDDESDHGGDREERDAYHV